MTRRGTLRAVRLFVPQVQRGRVALPPEELRHARRVLRLGDGDAVRLFDAAGREAHATLAGDAADAGEVEQRQRPHRITVAAAVPKGERADWLAEKLGELGVVRWVPLLTERGVVEPGGNKLDKWRRRAVEAAKQAGTAGVMDVAEPTSLADVLAGPGPHVALLTADAPAPPPPLAEVTLLVGPEGGWSPGEAAALRQRATPATLGPTTLRTETAAVCAAAVVIAGLPRPMQ